MSALFNFKPSIKNHAPDTLRITAPNEIRDNLWRALNRSLNDVIDRTGNGKTQFLVSPYTGYSKRQVFVFTTVFLYSVVTELSLEEFWRLTPEEHLEALGNLIDLQEPVEFDPTAEAPDHGLVGVFEPISPEELVEALSVRIPYLASQKAETLYASFNNRGYHTDVVAGWLTAGTTAYRRLQFIDPNQTFLTTEEWTRRVQETARLVEVLENSYTEVLAINKLINELIKKGKEAFELIDKQSDLTIEGKLSLEELWINFSTGMEGLELVNSEIARLCNTYDELTAKQALKDIKAMTPAEVTS